VSTHRPWTPERPPASGERGPYRRRCRPDVSPGTLCRQTCLPARVQRDEIAGRVFGDARESASKRVPRAFALTATQAGFNPETFAAAIQSTGCCGPGDSGLNSFMPQIAFAPAGWRMQARRSSALRAQRPGGNSRNSGLRRRWHPETKVIEGALPEEETAHSSAKGDDDTQRPPQKALALRVKFLDPREIG